MIDRVPTEPAPVESRPGLTLSVAEYCRLVGVGEQVVRQEIAANRIPHRKFGKRGLVRILRFPALEQLSAPQQGNQ